jgi:putative phosphotransacetylase
MKELVDKITEKIKQREIFEQFPIIVNISNRHVHLTKEHFEILFGENAQLTKYRDLLQPGQFAANETVTLIGPKGKFENVRIVGPLRKYTQIEISRSDSFVLGVTPPIRDSGNLAGSPGLTIVGPKGKVELKEGCIIALRHIHFTPEDAEKLGIKDKDFVKILAGKGKGRETIFSDVICRVSKDYATECHLDVEEANAANINNGDYIYILEKI